jgi:hypothetical protein
MMISSPWNGQVHGGRYSRMLGGLKKIPFYVLRVDERLLQMNAQIA